jgi:hypothetical protein
MAKVHYKAANVFTANDVRLLPGINQVGDADLERFLSHPGVQVRVKAGDIEVLEDKGAGKQRSVTDVAAEVASTFDLAALAALKDDDGRPGVVKAVDEQIAKIRADSGDTGGGGDQ